MNNNIINNVELNNGLNINPIPLEFSQTLTTTKWLASMQAKLSEVIIAVNSWYDTLTNDIENGGTLYQNILNHIDSEFIQQLDSVNISITSINNLIASINAIDVSLQAQINDLNYIKPSMVLTSSPLQTVYNVGETINSIVLNFNITKGNKNLVKAEIYKNGNFVTTINNIVEGVNTYVDANVINSSTSYVVKIFDEKGFILSDPLAFSFVTDYYFGVASTTSIINSAFITSLTSLKALNQNLQEEFNCINQKIVFAYPENYGDLISIIFNDSDVLESFDKTILMVNGVAYNVYTSSNYLSDIFDIIFNITNNGTTITNSNNSSLDGGIF